MNWIKAFVRNRLKRTGFLLTLWRLSIQPGWEAGPLQSRYLHPAKDLTMETDTFIKYISILGNKQIRGDYNDFLNLFKMEFDVYKVTCYHINTKGVAAFGQR